MIKELIPIIASIPLPLLIMITVGGVVAFTALYLFNSYTIAEAGYALGMKTDRRYAFIPVLRRMYELKMAKMHVGNILFFRNIGLALAFAIGFAAYRIIGKNIGAIVFVVVFSVWVCCALIVSFKYWRTLYEMLDKKSFHAFVHFAPVLHLIAAPYVMLSIAEDNSENETAVSIRQNARDFDGGAIMGVAGEYEGSVIEIAHLEEIVLGRDAEKCHLIFEQTNTAVSRIHCRIRYNGEVKKYIVTDLSKNGTYTADGRRLQPGIPVPLEENSIIYLGNTETMFNLS